MLTLDFRQSVEFDLWTNCFGIGLNYENSRSIEMRHRHNGIFPDMARPSHFLSFLSEITIK